MHLDTRFQVFVISWKSVLNNTEHYLITYNFVSFYNKDSTKVSFCSFFDISLFLVKKLNCIKKYNLKIKLLIKKSLSHNLYFYSNIANLVPFYKVLYFFGNK